MIITWAGFSCFKIESNNATVVLDPYNSSIGLKFPRFAADIVISTASDEAHGNIEGVSEKNPGMRIITGPGEYEIRDILIYGIPLLFGSGENSAQEQRVIFKIQMEGMNIVHLGNISSKLENSQLDHLEKTDILIIPVGGGKYLGGKAATDLVNQIEPRVVIPSCYKIPGVRLPVSALDPFCKEIGICPKVPIPKYKILKKDLPQDQTQVVILEAA